MKRLLFAVIVLSAIMLSCAEGKRPDFTADVKTVVKVKFVVDNKTEDGTCIISFIKNDEGIIIDSKCIGFYSDNTGTYRCDIAVGSDGKLVTEKIDVKAVCNLDVAG
jgi:hypothetical protein